MRFTAIFFLTRQLVMPRSRLQILRSHLCCSASAARNISSTSIARGPASSGTSSAVQECLKFVHDITASAAKPTEDRSSLFMNDYNQFSTEEKAEFLTKLAINYRCDNDIIQQNMTTLQGIPSTASPHKQQQRLRESLSAPYETLFKEIGSASVGVKFLVDLRSELIDVTRRCENPDHLSALQAMNLNLKQLLALWFGVGFLNLERLTWKSPCDLLEKVANYEKVHPVRNVSDLKLRVGPYRRCYVFLHPSMPGEPLVILHVALVEGISNRIQSIVHHPSLSHLSDFRLTVGSGEDLTTFNTAIFYSITSTQPGLKGEQVKEKYVLQGKICSIPAGIELALLQPGYLIAADQNNNPTLILYRQDEPNCIGLLTPGSKTSECIDLGNYLIKTVVGQLRSEFPHLTQFSSLSPIPGFRDWLFTEINQDLRGVRKVNLLSEQQVSILATTFSCKCDKLNVLGLLKQTLENGAWCKDPALAQGLQQTLMDLCARYLYKAKHRNFALNSVANFHLRNGATLWRINWLANTTAKGLAESCGIMVNYRYYLDRTTVNSEKYNTNYSIDIDKQVIDLLM